jgi:threonine/homoserine/homoserine lactone efflux protein
MLTVTTWLAFVALCTAMVLSPGPNMMYLVSRSICQGPRAGLVSLGGVALGFVVWMLLATFGITAMLVAMPFAYDALRIAGATYLAWLAWTTLKPGGRSPFQVSVLPHDSTRRLFTMGFVTNLLNPKAAVLYLSLLPQFIDPSRGSVLLQGLALGATQIVVSVIGNGLIALSAGRVASLLIRRPLWAQIQRWMMGTVLGALALRMAIEVRR